MKNILIGIVVIALLGAAGFYALNSYIYNEKQAVTAEDYKNAEYSIGAERIRLEDGMHQVPAAPDSNAMVTTQYFGNEARGDLDGDGDEDVVFLITQDGGGSGIFFYLVGAIKQELGYQGTSAVLIGDRIAPQTTEFRDGLVIVNYADRAPGEAMAAVPRMGKSLYLKYDPVAMAFGEVVQDFEGEADPSRMTLTMKTWNWVRTEMNDGSTITPNKPGVFTLTFNPNDASSFGATTDCNGTGGNYKAENGSITFTDMVQTLMFCAGSQESEFMKMLTDASGYHFTSKGELVLDLKFDSGSVIFR